MDFLNLGFIDRENAIWAIVLKFRLFLCFLGVLSTSKVKKKQINFSYLYLYGISCLKALLMQILIYIISRNVFLIKVNDLFFQTRCNVPFFLILYAKKKNFYGQNISSTLLFHFCTNDHQLWKRYHVSESYPSWIFWYYKLKNIRRFF